MRIENGEWDEGDIRKFGEEIERKFAEMDEIGDRWWLDEGRYIANAIDRGKGFYFGVSDWIKEGVETADDAGMVYNLSTEIAPAETQALGSYLTSALFTGRLNGILEITKLARDKGVEFGEGAKNKTNRTDRPYVGFGRGSGGDRTNKTDKPYVGFQEVGEYQFLPLEPREAIEYFEGLVPLTREELEEELEISRRDAFTVAGIQSKDVLEKVQDSLTDALAKGETFESWKKGIDEIMDNEGVSRQNPFRLRTVFNTNIHNALVAGRDRMTADLQRRGLVREYEGHTAGDARVRERHAILDGLRAPVNDPVWSLLNEYNCRCNKTPVLELL